MCLQSIDLFSNFLTAVYDGDVTYSASTSNTQNLDLNENSD
jgi:hypothetical protein